MLRKDVSDIAKNTWADNVKSSKQIDSGNKKQQEFSGACQLSQLSNEVNQIAPAKDGEISHKNLFADSIIFATGKTR